MSAQHESSELAGQSARDTAPRFDAFTLGELQLLHLGLAVIGQENRVDYALLAPYYALLGELGRALAATARAGHG